MKIRHTNKQKILRNFRDPIEYNKVTNYTPPILMTNKHKLSLNVQLPGRTIVFFSLFENSWVNNCKNYNMFHIEEVP